MKTTIDLPDELFRELKELAREQGVPMREVLVDGLRTEIERRREPRPKVDLVFPTSGDDGELLVDPRDMIAISYGYEPHE